MYDNNLILSECLLYFPAEYKLLLFLLIEVVSICHCVIRFIHIQNHGR